MVSNQQLIENIIDGLTHVKNMEALQEISDLLGLRMYLCGTKSNPKCNKDQYCEVNTGKCITKKAYQKKSKAKLTEKYGKDYTVDEDGGLNLIGSKSAVVKYKKLIDASSSPGGSAGGSSGGGPAMDDRTAYIIKMFTECILSVKGNKK